MAPRSKTKSLKYKVDTQPVRFAMNRGILVLEPKDHTTVMVGDKYQDIRSEGLTLEREGIMREMPFTRRYDPTNHEDLMVIEKVREHIAKNPILENGPVALRIVPENTPAPPIDTWDTMSAEAIVSFVKTTNRDLFDCVNYEANRDEPRADVIEALEKLNDDRKRQEAATADDKVKL